MARIFLDDFGLLGRERRGEVFGQNIAQRAVEPHVLHIGEVAVGHAIVVGGIGQDRVEDVFFVGELGGVPPRDAGRFRGCAHNVFN